MKAAVLTVSDSASAGTRSDLSGPAVKELLQQNHFVVEKIEIVPDEQKVIEAAAERMRSEGAKKTPLAALSRGVCGILGTSLILNLPGSPKAAVESLQAVIDLLPHALELLQGKTSHDDHQPN